MIQQTLLNPLYPLDFEHSCGLLGYHLQLAKLMIQIYLVTRIRSCLVLLFLNTLKYLIFTCRGNTSKYYIIIQTLSVVGYGDMVTLGWSRPFKETCTSDAILSHDSTKTCALLTPYFTGRWKATHWSSSVGTLCFRQERPAETAHWTGKKRAFCHDVRDAQALLCKITHTSI